MPYISLRVVGKLSKEQKQKIALEKSNATLNEILSQVQDEKKKIKDALPDVPCLWSGI